jgi:hypothetical protein
MGPILIKDLAESKDAQILSRVLGTGDIDSISRAKRIALNFLARNPSIANTRVGRSSSGSFYDYASNRLGVNSDSPDVLAHELGHAARLADASAGYKALLSASKGLSRINNLVSMPLATIVALNNNSDKEQRRAILKGLSLVSTAIAAPNLFEELAASTHAARNSDTPIRTAIRVAPGMISHALNDTTAPLTYLALNRLLDKDFK